MFQPKYIKLTGFLLLSLLFTPLPCFVAFDIAGSKVFGLNTLFADKLIAWIAK